MNQYHLIRGAMFLTIGLAIGGLISLVVMQGWPIAMLILVVTYVGLVMASWLSADEKVRRP